METETEEPAHDTGDLRNVVIIIDSRGNITRHTGFGQLSLITNADGNLKIDVLENVGDTIIMPVDESSDQQEVIQEGVEDVLEYVYDENGEQVLQETEEVDGKFMGEDGFIESTFMEENSAQEEEEEELALENEELHPEVDESSMPAENTSEVEEDLPVAAEDFKQKDEVQLCTICDRSFKTPASLKRHIVVVHAAEEEENDDPLAFELCLCCAEPLDSAHTSGKYKCSQCDKLFMHPNSVLRHQSMEHSTDGKWACVECTKVFTERALLLEHMKTHPFNKIHVCRNCNKEFTRKYHLERHLSQTNCDGNPPTSFECQVCNKAFSRKDNLREHLRAHAGQRRKSFICNYCNKEFKGSSMLAVHVRKHTGEKPYACDLCPKRFPSSGAMTKHRRMHTGEKPYKCPECTNTFAAKETLNRHVRTHTGAKPHSCHFCGKTFIQAAQLRAHIFHHTGENAYSCPHCNRAFNRRNRLTQHIKFVHEGAKPMICDHCGKSFFRKEDLVRHTYLHTGVKPFECGFCKKSFAIKSSLKLHTLVHRKEEPCSCEECGRAFIRQDCLMRHMRAKHRDVLEDIMAGAEKRRLQQQLLNAASDAALKGNNLTGGNSIWNELSLTDSIKELLTLLVDEATLKLFGWPDAQVDKILDSVIEKCGHKPASKEDFDYIGRLRENAKLLFTVVIDDEAVKSLLNNQTVDEVIVHVLRLAKGN